MPVYKFVLACALFCAVVNAQRPFYAGLRPIGYPQGESNVLTNKFGEDADVPLEARGDGDLINRLEQLPDDQKPFWYLNWRKYNEVRQNPQTYPQRPNVFVDGNTARN